MLAPKETPSLLFLDDQPVENEFDDVLGFSAYVKALNEFIVNEQTRTPLTLGIYGRWGTGKTTLMKLLEKKLSDTRGGKETNGGITTIWFNAWQYDNENALWAAFLQSIINNIPKTLEQRSTFATAKYRLKLLRKRIKRDVLLKHLIGLIIALIPVVITFSTTSRYLEPIANNPNLAKVGGIITSSMLAFWLTVKPFYETIKENVSIDFGILMQESDYQKHIAFLDRFRGHFQDIVDSLPGLTAKGGKRLVVFIDDLDRCNSDRILQVLDAIKLFLDVPGCVFVVGLDAEIARQAIMIKYRDDVVASHEYLEKIIQLPFQLPPLENNQIGNYLNRIAPNLPDKRCYPVFTTGLEHNPREIKRTINIFSLLWYLATNTHSFKVNAVRLSKIVVIQHGYQELYKILQAQPYLVSELEQFYLDKKLIEKDTSFNPDEAKNKVNMKILNKTLQEYFDETELKQVCDILDVDYEKLPGQGTINKIRELIKYVERHNLLSDLLQTIEEEREDINLVNDGIVPEDFDLSQLDRYTQRVKELNLSLELEPYSNNKLLNDMLLSNMRFDEKGGVTDDEECNFARLDQKYIEPYFTLTSQTDSPEFGSHGDTAAFPL